MPLGQKRLISMMRNISFLLVVLVLSFVFNSRVFAAETTCTGHVVIEGTVNAGTYDYLRRGFDSAVFDKCSSVLVSINTPGGSLQSTRLIVEMILASELPVLCLIEPSGGHAGSAGAIIMQACHLNGAIKATNIGAATPISSDGKEIPKDLRNKLMEDTRSWVVGLAKLRGRSTEFARDIIEKAKAVDATQAEELGAIDFVGPSREEFLKFVDGKETKMGEATHKVLVGELKSYEPDLRLKLLQLVGDPEIAYMIFMGSLALLYFELTHPGTIVPGVVGAMGLILSFIVFHKLQVYWGGVALILLGLVLMLLELFITSFGILAIGGVLSFFLGSLFLYDVKEVGYSLPLTTILPTTLFIGSIMFGITWLAMGTLSLKRKGSQVNWRGSKAKVKVLNEDGRSGQILLKGEIWTFISKNEVKVGDDVIIVETKGLSVLVQKEES